MKYTLDSTLPINAFSPRGGRSPFNNGMTLEGGGGGFVGKALGSVAKAVTGAVKGVVQPVYNATLKNIPGVDKALVNVDKSVGKAIPGGWGTVASIAASFIPGAQLAAMGMTQTGLATGLGALSGSGVMRGNHEFNLQGAIAGGAMAYGAGQIAQGFQEAGKIGTEAATSGAQSALTGTGAGYTPSDFLSGTSIGAGAGQGASALTPTANALAGAGDFVAPSLASSGSSAVPSAFSSINPGAAGDYGISASLPSAGAGASGAGLGGFTAPPSMLENVASGIADKTSAAFDPASYSGIGGKLSEAGSGTLSNMGDAGRGIANLTGFGDSTISNAASAFAKPITQGGVAATIMGGTGLIALEEQNKYLDEQAAAGAIGNAEYAAAKAKIDAEIATAKDVVSKNPLKSSADTDSIYNAPTTYDKSYDALYDKGSVSMYARGGEVQRFGFGGFLGHIANNPELMAKITAEADKASGKSVGTEVVKNNPLQTSAGLGNLSSFTNTPSTTTLYANNPKNDFYDLDRKEKRTAYAAGGMASGRFLSGGGDGMSDSIQANIGGTQEARLADGEFVVPADVVSHLGNGSSKAGAKQLYSMMDKVRQARVGTKKQGKQINPRKYLAA